MDSIQFQNLINALSASLKEVIKCKIGLGDIHLDENQSLRLKGHDKRNIKILSTELITFDDGSTLDWACILNVYDLMIILEWLENWRQQKNSEKISIVWSTYDFEDIAAKNEENENVPIGSIYDRSKFKLALEMLKKHHDCNNGITWHDIGYHLDEYCKINEADS